MQVCSNRWFLSVSTIHMAGSCRGAALQAIQLHVLPIAVTQNSTWSGCDVLDIGKHHMCDLFRHTPAAVTQLHISQPSSPCGWYYHLQHYNANI
jgi:hypothetical protein